MPVSTEKNFDKKFSLFREWLSTQDRFKGENLKIEPHESSIASGFSNETFVFSVKKKDYLKNLVLRLKPSGYQVFPDYNLRLQADIMNVLNKKGLPTPKVILYESDENIIGSEFYLMNYLEGEAPSDNPPYHMDPDGMMGKASPEERRKVWTEWLHYLINLHLLDFKELGLSELEEKYSNKDPLDMDIDYYQNFLEWGMEDETNELCENVISWLRLNKPKSFNKFTLCWGDSRPGNILYKNFKATALLDWEMAVFGDPLSDLAWGFAVDDSSSLGLNVEKLEGSMNAEEAIMEWEDKTKFSAENYNYYRILSLLKFSVIMIRVAKKLVFNEIIPLESDFYKNNHISNFLEKEFNKL